MGGVDGGVGLATVPSPQQEAIEKVLTKLRQQYDDHEKLTREREFLEKGGDALDYYFKTAASVSVQSTSLNDQHHEQEVKVSLALAASPPGDSIESSGRLGTPSVCEPNSADNLMLFEGDNGFSKVKRDSAHRVIDKNIQSEQLLQLDGSQNAKESGESAASGIPEKAYKRRPRSRPNRDGARSSSTDAVPSRGCHSFLPSRHASRDAKGFKNDADNHERYVSTNANSKPPSPSASSVLKVLPSDTLLEKDASPLAVESANSRPIAGSSSATSDANASRILHDGQVLPTKPGFQESPAVLACDEPESVGEQAVLVDPECQPCVVTQEIKSEPISMQMNGVDNKKVEQKEISNVDQDQNRCDLIARVEEFESPRTQACTSLDGNNGCKVDTRKDTCNGSVVEQKSESLEARSIMITKKDDGNTIRHPVVTNDNANSFKLSHLANSSLRKEGEEMEGIGPALKDEVKSTDTTKSARPDSCTASEKKSSVFSGSNITSLDGKACSGRSQSLNDPLVSEVILHVGGSIVDAERPCSSSNLKLANKAREDAILEEARVVETKRKRIAQLSFGTLPSENRQKSHWDFVLEEMAWMANDFAQERLWKLTAAAQVSRRAAISSHLRFQNQNSLQKQKELARTVAEVVMGFWCTVQETSKDQEYKRCGKDLPPALQGYAVRFLKYNSSSPQCVAAEAPGTPDRILDLGILDVSWEDHLTEENLFYAVPPGAIEAYRMSIESLLLQREKTGSIQEEVETSDVVADSGTRENAFEDCEGETRRYYLPGVVQKKRKHLKSHTARSHEMETDMSFMGMENNVGNQPSLIGKRPANSLKVSFPTKRMRTAPRQRVLSPFGAGTSDSIQLLSRADASSGDTSSFQDDQSTLHGGSQILNGLEAESGDSEKHLQFDSTEVSNKPKKKRKGKHLGSTYDHRWQLGSNFQNDQRDDSKRRLESVQFETNGNGGLFGQHVIKKQKMLRPPIENSFDNLTPTAGSVPSPVASQMSNMSDPNKFIKMLSVRDRGRKTKALKTPAGQPGSGSPWSLFEDQALVVLVHDMGPNWELVSDAINSTLQFKCIFRKPKECKERHKALMDKTGGDGADSAEESGSSPHYKSTLPGIPKGSARQLFQRLQGPMEEDILKSHFEKIIAIGQKQHYRLKQNDNKDHKQLLQPHSSHALALSQVFLNNLKEGPVLTPLDLCDSSDPSPDILPLGYQGPHASGLPSSNHGIAPPLLPSSGANSSMQEPSNMVLGSNISSPSSSHNAPARDGRCSIPRTSLSVEEQQRMQQYNQLLTAKNLQQSALPGPGAYAGMDHGVRMLPGGNGMGILSGPNRSGMPTARPGFQGISPSSMLNSGSMLSTGKVGMPSPVSIHAGGGPGQGNSMLRPRDSMHMMRHKQNVDHQRQMTVPELHMQQVSQGGTSQGVSPFVGGLSSSFPTQTATPPVQSYPVHQQQPNLMSPQQLPNMLSNNSHHPQNLQGPTNHANNPQHQAYAMRLAKEKHLQQQRLRHQQQFATTNALMPQTQPPQPQPPVSSPQNSNQTSPLVSLSPINSATPIAPHKNLVPQPHGLVRNHPQTNGGQVGKQQRRQSQQHQLAGRQHPQQRQSQTKLNKGNGRGTVMMHPEDPPLSNGFSGSQSSMEKVELHIANHFMRGGQGGLNPAIQSTKQTQPPHSLNQQKMHSDQSQLAMRQQKPSNSSDSNNQTHVQPVVSSSTSNIASSNRHQPHPHAHLKLVNQTPAATMERATQLKRQDSPSDMTDNMPQSREASHAEQTLVTPNKLSHLGCQAPLVALANCGTQPVASSSAGPQWNTSEKFYDSSGLMSEHVTDLGNLAAAGGDSEPSGPAIGQGLVERPSSSDSLPNFVGREGTEWQQQQKPAL